jgi:outer membrane protein TolC
MKDYSGLNHILRQVMCRKFRHFKLRLASASNLLNVCLFANGVTAFIITWLLFRGCTLAKRNIIAVIGVSCLAGLGGCSIEPYRPVPLNSELSLSEFTERSLADPVLADFARQQRRADIAWPPSRWGWQDLSLVGAFYHPDIAVARARQQIAQSATAAGQHSSIGGGLLLEHHSDTAGKSSIQTSSNTSPWSFGIDVELPANGSDRRAARTELYEAQFTAARSDTAATLWHLQIRILRSFIDLFAARSDISLQRDETAALAEIQFMLAKRLEVGGSSATEVAAAQQRRLIGEQALSEAAVREEDAFAALAEAIGVTTAALRKFELGFDGLGDLPRIAASSERLRELALRDHTDLQRLLADYVAAEAAVKLEVARQYPEFSFKPGYLWDQGDNRWSLAIGWLAPPTFGNQPAIREAEAKRQLAAQQFMARQATVIAEIEAATARQRLTGAAWTRSQALVMTALASEVRSRHGYEAGALDRLELISTRLEKLAAERTALSRHVAALQAQADLAAALQPKQLVVSPLALEAATTKTNR